MSSSLPSGLPHRLLTMKETAEYLNVSLRWMEDAVQSRRVRCTRLGRHIRFTPDQIQEIIAAGEQVATLATTRPTTDKPKTGGTNPASRSKL
jgi:excisionase family DNA binding protein